MSVKLDGFILNGTEYQMTDAEAHARIDNLVSQNNPTQGNSELLDIRVGANGKIYESAGQAIRENFTQVTNDISGLQEVMVRNSLTNMLTWNYGLYLTDTGKEAKQPSYAVSDFFRVFSDEIILHQITSFLDISGVGLNIYIHEYDKDMNWIQRISLKTQNSFEFKTPIENKSVEYIRFSVGRYADTGIIFTPEDLSYLKIYLYGGIYGRFSAIFQENVKLSMGTFNVGGYSGGNPEPIDIPTGDVTEYSKYISSLGVDVLCLQEDREFWDIPQKITTKEKIYEHFYNYGGVVSKSTSNNGIWAKSIYSNYLLNGGGKYTFLVQGEDPTTGNNLWNSFTFFTMHLKGIKVLMISVHLAPAVNNIEARKAQIKEILQFIEGYKYVVISGDFNVWEDEYDLFDDQKFNKANGGVFGQFSTFTSKNFHPFDSIITTKNIKILNPKVHDNEFGDHFAVTCDLIFSI